MPSTAYQVMRLPFRSLDEFSAFYDANEVMFREVWRWGEQEGAAAQPCSGICDLCDCQTQFTGSDVMWRRACGCGLPNVERSALRVLTESYRAGDSIYHVGHFSRLRAWLSEHFPNVHASQYEEGREPGEVVDGVRFEDLTRLSYGDRSFDHVVCTEVLEHIPRYEMALREMARVLKPQGRAILTFPWLGLKNYEHLIRAELQEDGTVHHLLPPEYHGDPAKSEAILSFRSFGWKVLDDLRRCGFREARAEFIFAPVHGYFTLLNPVIVGLV